MEGICKYQFLLKRTTLTEEKKRQIPMSPTLPTQPLTTNAEKYQHTKLRPTKKIAVPRRNLSKTPLGLSDSRPVCSFRVLLGQMPNFHVPPSPETL